MLPGISAKRASHLGWLRILLEPIDLPRLSDRLTVHGVLESFDHRFKVPNAFLQVLKTLRSRRVLPAGIGRDPRWGAHVPLASPTLVRRLTEGLTPSRTPSGPIIRCRLMT
jgi:hypothetical protein